MKDLEHEIRSRYLDHLDESTWIDEDPRLDFGTAALPYFIVAFEKENDAKRRARLVRIIWQFRDPAALPALAAALRDRSKEVWKDALDGIVTLGGKQALELLSKARVEETLSSPESDRIEWIDEAARQVSVGRELGV